MKKTVLFLCVLLISVCVFAQTGVIRELTGTVEVKTSGANDFAVARVGDRVNQDTIISTGFRSTALIEVGSNVLTVRPLTRLTLTEISASSDSETLNVNLQAGRLRVDVNPPAGTRADTSVSSPSATASVRGTSFEVDTKNIRVINGSVRYSGHPRGSGAPGDGDTTDTSDTSDTPGAPGTTMGTAGLPPMMLHAGNHSGISGNNKPSHPLDNKNNSYQPPPPAGTDPAATSTSAPENPTTLSVSVDW